MTAELTEPASTPMSFTHVPPGPVSDPLRQERRDHPGRRVRGDSSRTWLRTRRTGLPREVPFRGRDGSVGQRSLRRLRTIHWIVNQPWSNGRVGMTGLSYVGFTQWAALSTNHPALRAIAPRSSNTNLGAAPLTPGEPEWTFYFQHVMDFYAVNDLLAHDEPYDYSRRPLVNVFEEAVGQMGSACPRWTCTCRSSRRFAVSPKGIRSTRSSSPVLLSLGWFDPYCRGEAMRDYHAMTTNPAWKPLVHLRLGPHDHDDTRLDERPAEVAHQGSIDIPLNTPEQIRAWFEGNSSSSIAISRRTTRSSRCHPCSTSWRTAVKSAPPASGRRRRPHARCSISREVRTLSGSWRLGGPGPGGRCSRCMTRRNGADRHPDVVAAGRGVARLPRDDQPRGCARVPLRWPGTAAGTGRPGDRPRAGHHHGPAMDLFAFLLDLEPDGSARFICRGSSGWSGPSRRTSRCPREKPAAWCAPAIASSSCCAASDYPDFIPLTDTRERRWLAETTRPTTQSLEIGGEAGARLELTTL